MGDRDRSPRRDRRSGGGGGGSGPRQPADRRIFVSNLPFETKWQDIKDLFRKEVGEVSYVKLFNDENEKPRGAGVLEFASAAMAKQAIDKMHRYSLSGRNIVVKEDFDAERDQFGRIMKGSGGGGGGGGGKGGGGSGGSRGGSNRRSVGPAVGSSGPGGLGSTFGLSPQFLDSLDINSPLNNRVFVANLAYEVDERKLRDVFKLAGRVVTVELTRDKEGKSRGFAVVTFDHPVESVQAISMLHNQTLFERRISVRLDKLQDESERRDPNSLPDGLSGVGMGLGTGGQPLTDVAKNLPSSGVDMAAMGNMGNMGMGGNAGGMGGGGMGGNNNMGANMAGNNAGGQAAIQAALASIATMVGMGAGNMGGGGGNMGNMGASNMGGGNMGNMGGGNMGGGNMGGGNMGMGNMGSGNMGGGGGMGDNRGGNNLGMGGGGNGNNMGGGGGRSRTSDTVIVKNLPFNCNWQALKDGFRHIGDIKFAEIKDKGVGVVRFSSERDAEKAVEMMDRQRIQGDIINVGLF